MQEALNIHFQGLIFREKNAGKTIDEHMTDRGFDNQIGVHPATGKLNLFRITLRYKKEIN